MIIQINVPIYLCSVLCFCDSNIKEFNEFYNYLDELEDKNE